MAQQVRESTDLFVWKRSVGWNPETNIAHEIPIFLGKYHQNGGFSMAMLVLGRVHLQMVGVPGNFCVHEVSGMGGFFWLDFPKKCPKVSES